MNKRYFNFFTVLLIAHVIVLISNVFALIECKSSHEEKIIIVDKVVGKVANNTKTPPKREGENRPLPFPIPIPIPIPKPDGPPIRPPIVEDETDPYMVVNGKKLFMVDDLRGRKRWIPEGQEKNFKKHEIAAQKFDSKNFDSQEFNYEWTAKMQESVFQEIQSRDDNLFSDISIENVDCRADIGCRIDATAINEQGKQRLPKLAYELGNVGKPKDSLFYRTYSMENTDRELGIMRIYISASVYDQ